MEYISTRNKSISVSSAYAISKGISSEGGLFVPNSFPKITNDELTELSLKDYEGRAKAIFAKFLTDFTNEELEKIISEAYGNNVFENNIPAPLVKLDEGKYILELWHGPTCAFKDMALQFLPKVLPLSVRKTGENKKTVILVATSGDTGKAALEGFSNVPDTEIIVFYPSDGVSPMQKLQMVTQTGENVKVYAVKGNFDDTQTAVKKVFTDSDIINTLSEKGKMFSSANSINIGRLLPQVVYYVSAYCSLIENTEIKIGDPVNVVVPTGNFGNILAAYYAKKMGVPFSKLICASNSNNVLTDFFNTGVYNKNREFYATCSPSMDILVSSNLERLLFEVFGRDDECVREKMHSLVNSGNYSLTKEQMSTINDSFFAGWCSDEDTAKTIKDIFDSYSYAIDTHTAVAMKVYKDYIEKEKDDTKTIVVSTASPYKFPKPILSALGENVPENEFVAINELSKVTKTAVPSQISSLEHKEERFNCVIAPKDIGDIVLKTL